MLRFLMFCLPQYDQDLRSQVVQRKTYVVGQKNYLTYDIEINLARLFELELEVVHDLIFLVEKLRHSQHFNMLKSFKKIDFMNKGFIDQPLYFNYNQIDSRLFAGNTASKSLTMTSFS